MTCQQFLANFFCRVVVQNQGNTNLVITTEVIRLIDREVVDRVRAVIDIQETNNWVFDSNSIVSETPWSWDKLVDQTKRAQLDYFAQRAPIVNYYPMNSSIDISNVYI